MQNGFLSANNLPAASFTFTIEQAGEWTGGKRFAHQSELIFFSVYGNKFTDGLIEFEELH